MRQVGRVSTSIQIGARTEITALEGGLVHVSPVIADIVTVIEVQGNIEITTRPPPLALTGTRASRVAEGQIIKENIIATIK